MAWVLASILGHPKDKIVTQSKIKKLLTAKTNFAGNGLRGSADSFSIAAASGGSRRVIRSGNSGGKKAMIMTRAERATPRPTSEPSWARPGNPPKLSTRKAQMVVMAAQKMLGAMARRISGTD